jgi:hypothetical protein
MRNLEQHNSQQNRHVATHVWSKPYGVCKAEKKKLEAQKQLPGTYFKIVRA